MFDFFFITKKEKINKSAICVLLNEVNKMFKLHYGQLLGKIDAELQSFMDEQLALVKNNSFLTYYYSKISDYLFNGGKRIRPVLMLLSYGAINPEELQQPIIRASLSIELLHNASLIHDDIMDNAETRRGQKAFHGVLRDYAQENYSSNYIDHINYGLAMGILGGDFVYNLAYKILQNHYFSPDVCLRAASEFTEGFLEVVKGVIFETDMQGRFESTESEYFDMIAGKTASLFEKSAKMGAIYANGSDSQISALANFAKNAGIAFQIVDDVIGTFGDETKTGKPIDSDIREGKRTILLIKALENANEEQRKILYKFVGNKHVKDEDVELVRNVMKDTGALVYAKEKAESLFKSCQYFLKTAEPQFDPKYVDYLNEIAAMGILRDK